jgi:hypothetical protein
MTMKTTTEFQTLDIDQLLITNGGDFAHDYKQILKKDVKDWGHRVKGAATSLVHGDVGGTVNNVGAADVDYAKTIGDALIPVSAIVGAKP